MAAIDFDEVTKNFGNAQPAVDRLSLHIDDGEFMVLVGGPSGLWQDNALRMLAGLEEITSGTLKIGDAVVNNMLPARPRRRDGLSELRPLSPHVRRAEHRLRSEDSWRLEE